MTKEILSNSILSYRPRGRRDIAGACNR